MSTDQQDTREQQIEALARLACRVENGGDDTAWNDDKPIGWSGESARAWYRDRAESLLGDPLVARMIADAERRGAVKALRNLAAERWGLAQQSRTWGAAQTLRAQGDRFNQQSLDIENGVDL